MDAAGGRGPPASNSRENSRERRRKAAGNNMETETIDNKTVPDNNTGKHNQQIQSANANTQVPSSAQQTPAQPEYFYDNTHKGPFMVYIDAYDGSGMRKYINGIVISKLLLDLKIKDVIEVVKIGFGRCKVTFRTYQAANAIVKDERFLKVGYAPKIFAHFVSKVAIAFDIPTTISEEEFMNNVESPIPIIKCIRIVRRKRDKNDKNPDDNVAVTPTGSMKIIFKGNEIPNEVTYGYIKVPVKHYVAFAQCYRCFRYNHFAQHCKQNYELCVTCYKQHAAEDICGEVSCPNCKGNHPPTFKECPARMKAFALKKMMTIENLSIKEARTRFSNLFTNRFSILEDNAEFPPLKISDKKANVQNNSQEAAKSLHAALPYAKVVKNNTNRQKENEKARANMQQWREVVNNHSVSLPYNTTFKQPQAVSNLEKGSQNPILFSQEINESQNKIQETFSQVALQLSNFLTEISSNDIDPDKTKKLIRNLRNNVNEGINLMDVNRIRQAGLPKEF